MGVSTAIEARMRVLGLGNEILADDALGIRVIEQVRQRFGEAAETVASEEAGFRLMEDLLGVEHLLVIDTVQTGKVAPGTISFLDEDEVRKGPGSAPHGVGIFEVLAAARTLGLAAPRRVTAITVEAVDCSTVGGPMDPDVAAAIPRVVDWVGRFLRYG
jgi:hydrogenase maturation protease